MCKERFCCKAAVVTTILAIIVAVNLPAQIKQIRPTDIGSGLKSGSVHATITPSFTGDTLKPFDSNQFNALELLGTDSITITLQFDSSIQIEKSKVFFWHGARWTLETANSLGDLNSKTGTYSKPVDARTSSAFLWDSASFVSQRVYCVRLSVKNPADSSIRLGEWTLEGTVTFTKFLILPQPARVLPGTNLQLRVKIVDDQNNIYSNFLSGPLKWSCADGSIATVDEYGVLRGIALGATAASVTTVAQTLKGTVAVTVESDFRPQKVKPMTVKVALVLQDPVLPSSNRIHEEFGWRDPRQLANRLVVHFREATDSVVNFQFVEIIDANVLFTRFYGNLLGVTKYVQLLKEPGWKTLHAASDSGQIWFDYREMVKYYHFDEKRNNDSIDEVWVFAAPFLGMYESQLMGPKAFWWNSPPIKDSTALTKLLSVMGLNYERGVDQAFHSFGHRVESAMVQAYLEAQGRSWNPKSIDPTPWDLFTRIEKDMPGQAHVGNVHFPPNGAHDYDYGNSTIVKSFAENWYRYPYLLDQSSQVNVATWLYTPGEPLAEGQDHLGYLRWWYGHLPRYVGVTEGVLNNWWHYALDYEAAVALAKSTPVVGVYDQSFGQIPRAFDLRQNFPNPFNPATTIRFSIPERGTVNLRVFDVLGREVKILVNEVLPAGTYERTWDAKNCSSGVYFYRLQAGGYSDTRKLVLLK